MPNNRCVEVNAHLFSFRLSWEVQALANLRRLSRRKKSGTSLADFESVKDALRIETDLPISLENYYKFLVLLPLEADEKMEVLDINKCVVGTRP
jgi:hypothetical protein